MITKTSEWNSERMVELPGEDFSRLEIKEGELLRLKGRRTCHALASLAAKGKLKEGEIGIGVVLQKRLGTTVGSEIKVTKGELPKAERLQFLASADGMPGESASFMFKSDDDKRKLSNNIRLAISALAYLPVRKGESFVVNPLSHNDVNSLCATEVTSPEMYRLIMSRPVYIKIVDAHPGGEAICGPETEWCEADLHQYLKTGAEVSFDMVGGLASVKEQLRNAVEGPIRNAGKYHGWSLRPTKGILLFGPPGCGKTMLAKAVAKELEAELIYIRGSEVYNAYFGASEQIVREIFQYARNFPRAVIFWDEFDAVGTSRNTAGTNSRLFDTILNTILVEMDGMSDNQNVVVIAATNRIDQLDPALKRPGRFDFVVRIPLPTEPERREILSIYLKTKPGAEKINLETLATRTAGYTGADLENLVRLACLEAIEKEGADKLEQKHIEFALSASRPSLTKEQVEYYEQMISGTGNPSVGKLPMFR